MNVESGSKMGSGLSARSGRRVLAEFLLQAVAIGDMHLLDGFEVLQQASRGAGIMSEVFEVDDNVDLTGNMVATLGDMSLGQRQMVL